jgi:MacB-like periplasmic core domain
MIQGVSADLRYALRLLRRSPGFTLVAVLSLTLGIGANSAMFGVVRTLLLTPVPVAAPQELAIVSWWQRGDARIRGIGTTDYADPATGTQLQSSFTAPMVRAMRAAAPPGTSLFAFAFVRGVSVALGDEPALLAGGALVDGRYFSTLGVPMAFGRPLTDADDRPDAPLVVVLGHAFWMRAFGGDPGVIGRIVRMNGNAAEVVGVTAEGFDGLSPGGYFPQTEVTVPLSTQPRVFPRLSDEPLLTADDVFWLRLMARVPEAESPALVARALQAAMLSASPTSLDVDGRAPVVRLLPGDRGAQPVGGDTARWLRILLGVVGIVLLITCVNLSSLMLARGSCDKRSWKPCSSRAPGPWGRSSSPCGAVPPWGGSSPGAWAPAPSATRA